MQRIIFLFVFSIFLFSCKKDKPTAATVTPTPQSAANQVKSSNDIKAENLENLKARALDEGDTFGRVNASLGSVMNQFKLSNNLRQEDGKRSIFVDEKFTIIVRHEKDGNVTDLKVNLKNLNQENGGMRLIPDNEIGELPGFAISVIDGKPGVEVIENGKKIREERELKIYMADRTLIEQAVPAFLQALNIVHGRY